MNEWVIGLYRKDPEEIITLKAGVGWSEEGTAASCILGRIEQEMGGGHHGLGKQRRKWSFQKREK